MQVNHHLFRFEGGFFMLVEIKAIKKSVGGRVLVEIDNWQIEDGDRIGIVGANGSGKTTLLNLLSNKEVPDRGSIRSFSPIGYLEQLPDAVAGATVSGGEETKRKLQKAFELGSGILLADEPTSHLDKDNRLYLEKAIKQFNGAVLVVSHDRTFLNQVCTKIVELERGKTYFYEGNYDDYLNQKELKQHTEQAEYHQYEKEKKRLKQVARETETRSSKIRKAPKRMGNSEARLHKMGDQKAKKKLGQLAKNAEKRLDQLDVKQAPTELANIKIKLAKGKTLHAPILLSATKLTKKIDERILLNQLDFSLVNHSKTALIGGNGVGKTTLLKLIIENSPEIQKVKNLSIGYFSQKLELLEEESTILENVMKESVHDETFVRMLLARLLFRKQDVYKKVHLLSGGEKNKVSLAKLLVSDANLLLLDEPTNYLDIPSLKAVEEALMAYEGTLLFVSHDETFNQKIATHYWEIKQQKLTMWEAEKNKETSDKKIPVKQSADEKLVLETQLTAIIGKLSNPNPKEDRQKLENEYQTLLKKLKE